MPRPFSLTMQAHRLDLHRLWQALLGISGLMALAWAWWAVTAHGLVDEHSTRVPEQFPIGSGTFPGEERGSIARRRVQLGVFGAETYSSTLSTENVEMGPYPQRVSPALHDDSGSR